MPHPRSALILATTFASVMMAHPASGQTETRTYATINGRPLQLDFRRQNTAGPAPLIIWIHGGGWSGGTRAIPPFLQPLSNAGYAIASIDYRLTSEADLWGGAPVTWPAQAHDCKAAVRWLRANAASLNVDPRRFIAWGSSAGGHLAAMLATSNRDPYLNGDVGDFDNVRSDVQLGVDYFGPADLLYIDDDVTDPPGSDIDHDAINSPESRLLGADVHGHSVGDIRAHIDDPTPPWPELVALAQSASPARLAVRADNNVPIFVAHGDQDRLVPIGQSIRLRDALAAAGTPVEMVTIAGAGHGLPPNVALLVRDWLNAQLTALRCNIADVAIPFGILDINDILAFSQSYFLPGPAADLYPDGGDGVRDINDVLTFAAAFSAGCP